MRHYLLTGVLDPSLDGHWGVYEALYGRLGSSVDVMAHWDPAAAFGPYRATLRAEGLTLPRIAEIDDED